MVDDLGEGPGHVPARHEDLVVLRVEALDHGALEGPLVERGILEADREGAQRPRVDAPGERGDDRRVEPS